MRIRCRFEDKTFTVGLLDNPSARDLVVMLPLDLVIEDFSTNEKIAYLPRKLTKKAAVRSRTKQPAISATTRHGATSPSFMAATNIRAA